MGVDGLPLNPSKFEDLAKSPLYGSRLWTKRVCSCKDCVCRVSIDMEMHRVSKVKTIVGQHMVTMVQGPCL